MRSKTSKKHSEVYIKKPSSEDMYIEIKFLSFIPNRKGERIKKLKYNLGYLLNCSKSVLAKAS